MEGDDDELEDLDCMLTRRGVYSRAAFISLSASNCAAFIRGRRLFEGGVYSRKYVSVILKKTRTQAASSSSSGRKRRVAAQQSGSSS